MVEHREVYASVLTRHKQFGARRVGADNQKFGSPSVIPCEVERKVFEPCGHDVTLAAEHGSCVLAAGWMNCRMPTVSLMGS